MTDQHFDEDGIAALVRDAALHHFDAGFTDRVLERVRSQREAPLLLSLQRQFVRIVPLAAAATILLAAYNWWGGHESAASAIDAALNLPQVTLSSAYSATALYGVANAAPDTP
jgi:hypothetical protein